MDMNEDQSFEEEQKKIHKFLTEITPYANQYDPNTIIGAATNMIIAEIENRVQNKRKIYELVCRLFIDCIKECKDGNN